MQSWTKYWKGEILLTISHISKRTVFYGLETLSFCATHLPGEFNQRNKISIFKNDVKQRICNQCHYRLCKVVAPNLRLIWHIAPIFKIIIVLKQCSHDSSGREIHVH